MPGSECDVLIIGAALGHFRHGRGAADGDLTP